MNIEELVRVHGNINRWLCRDYFLDILRVLVTPNEIDTLGRHFKIGLVPSAPFEVMFNHEDDRSLADYITFAEYTTIDIEKLRELEYDAGELHFDRDSSIVRKENLPKLLLANIDIAPELEKRDGQLCAVFGTLYDLMNSKSAVELKRMAGMDYIDVINSIESFAALTPKEQVACAWSLAVDKDPLKAGLSSLVCGVTLDKDYRAFKDYCRIISEKIREAERQNERNQREMSGKDRRMGEYAKKIADFEPTIAGLRNQNAQLLSAKTELEQRLMQASAPQVPPDISNLQAELDKEKTANTTYEQLLQEADEEIKALRQRIQILEARPANGSALPSQPAGDPVYAEFRRFTDTLGYNPDLVGAIIQANAKFTRRHVPRNFISKNTGNKLEDKALISGFENTFSWLVRCNVFVNKAGDTYSINTKVQEIESEALRNYVSSLLDRRS
jgi:hypothetical protein